MIAKIALRNVFRNSRRSTMTLFVIVFGSTGLILFGGYREVTYESLRESFIRGYSGHVQVYGQGYLEAESQKPLEHGIDGLDNLRHVIEADPRVQSTAAQITLMGLVTNGEKSDTFMAMAVEPQRDKLMRSQMMKSGEFLSEDETDGVIIGDLLAKSMRVKTGDYLTLMTMTSTGSLNGMDVHIRGTFATSMKEYDEHAIKMPLAGAQHLLRTNRVEKVLVLLKDTRDTDAVGAWMRSQFAARGLHLEMRDWSALAVFYHQVVMLYNGIFGFLGAVVFVIVVLSVANTTMMSVLERTREIGTMMAIGTRGGRIWQLFLTEGFFIGLLGGAAGLAVGYGFTILINHAHIQMPPPPGSSTGYLLEIAPTASVLIISFLLAIVTAPLSSVLPALKASRLKIVDALAHT